MQTQNFEKLARRILAIQSPRIFFLSIPKCGCTFVKNVLWRIQAGSYHPNPMRVHDSEEEFHRAHEFISSAADARREPAMFTVLRNPVDRFLSLYLDKVVGPGRKDFVPLAETLVRNRGLIFEPQTISEHHFNLDLLSGWLSDNLHCSVDLPRNAHWSPQSDRIAIVKAFDLKLMVVDKLTFGLEALLLSEIPDIVSILRNSERNRSRRSSAKSELITSSVRRRINELYARDRALYQRVSSTWIRLSGLPISEVEVPRFSSLFGT